MKIYGLDGKEYNTVEECIKADEAYTKAKEEAEAKEAENKALVSKQKKEKADAIKAAEDDLALAQTAYDRAEEKAREVILKAKEEAKSIMSEASKTLKEASNKKYETIAAFNKDFGVYTAKYTGKEALEEYNRFVRNFNNIWNNLFSWF